MSKNSGEKRKRGRPRLDPKRQEEMRNRITDQASKLFKSEGYGAVSMRRLGKELGVTPMTLYTYFPSKLSILSKLWNEILDEVFEKITPELEPQLGARAKLETLSSAYVSYWLENRENYHLVFMSSGLSREDVESFMTESNTSNKFEIFFQLVGETWRENPSGEMIKLKTDQLLCALHGIMHCIITIPGYGWSETDKLIASSVAAVLPTPK